MRFRNAFGSHFSKLFLFEYLKIDYRLDELISTTRGLLQGLRVRIYLEIVARTDHPSNKKWLKTMKKPKTQEKNKEKLKTNCNAILINSKRRV